MILLYAKEIILSVYGKTVNQKLSVRVANANPQAATPPHANSRVKIPI
jgi:hypothetical protein